MAGKPVTLRIRPLHMLYHDDRVYGPGELVELSAADAKTLLADGIAQDPDAPLEDDGPDAEQPADG